MVLTNFEFWAADGSTSSLPSSASTLEFETSAHHHHHTRHLNPFDPRVVPHVPTRNLTSSNGYYGFSYINAAHELGNNNNNNIDIANNNNLNSNNNTSTHNFMANDVNGMKPAAAAHQQENTHKYNFISNAELPAGNAASRCKKRFFVVNADECSADDSAAASYCSASANKRCRFDNDFAAQYCNDFFSLPSTQIATQSCLMDTEEGINQQQQQQQTHHDQLYHHQQQQQQQLHQQQVDEAMFENNNNNICNNNNNNNNVEKYEQSILHLQLQQQQQLLQQQSQMQTQQPPTIEQQQPQQQQQQQHPHQQQHYQGHLHRSNRDT